ncbi:hypothetical protein ABIB66_006563 [Bradyrhizobium sp. F1.13.3]
MRCWLIAAGFALFASGAAFAQMTGMAAPTPTVGATSPLGSTTGSPISPIGIGLGATELPSAGLSPAPVVTGSIATPTTGTACSTLGSSPSGMYGSTSTYDGGGMAMAGSTPATGGVGNTAASTSSGIGTTSSLSMTSATMQSPISGTLDTAGMSGMCGSGSSSIAASSSPTSTVPTTSGGSPKTGLPFGSTEIGNLGVSSATLLPTPAVPLVTGSVTPILPPMPIVTPPAASASTFTPGCPSLGTSTSTGSPSGC